jgi:hypothetical protein
MADCKQNFKQTFKHTLKLREKCSLMLAVFMLTTDAFAGPLGFKGSVMAMGDFSPNWQESFANYAFTPVDAVGIEGVRMRSDDKTLTRQAGQITYTRRLARWNTPDSQANVFLLSGVGTLVGNNLAGSQALFTPGLQADYETTRVYASTVLRAYRGYGAGNANVKHDYGSLRAGFSFYEADYDETQPWLIVEARRMKGLSERTEITPMLRLINKRYFIEAGVSTAKQARFNFMYIF